MYVASCPFSVRMVVGPRVSLTDATSPSGTVPPFGSGTSTSLAIACGLLRIVHLGDQGIDGDARAPFGLGLEIDRRLVHFGGRRIGRGRGASGFAEHRYDFGKCLDDAVLHL